MKATPIIVIGMHRSGTSLVARLLSRLGVQMGRRLAPSTHEAVLFQRLNKWMLRAAGGSMEHPEAVDYFLRDEPVRAAVTSYVEFVLRTPALASFVGWRDYVRYRTPEGLAFSWGWKDPRTTLTLPIWLDVFPDARVLHVRRHGIDVARSLKKRHDAVARHVARESEAHPVAYWMNWMRKERWGPTVRFDVRSASIEDALQLWAEYIDRAEAVMAQHTGSLLEIRYEDLLQQPRSTIRAMAQFVSPELEEVDIAVDFEALAKDISPDRAFAYRGDDALLALASEFEDLLASGGYPPSNA